MNKIYIKRLLSLIVVAVLAVACDDLTETNKNPNESLSAQPDYLLTNVLKSSVDTYWGVDNTMNSTLLFVQHWAKIQYTEQDRYAFVNTDFESGWRNFYSGSLSDLAEIIRLSEESGNNNYKGVALILRAWVFGNLTDLYGAVPYTQATSIDEYLTPTYDNQETVYNGILADLETGVALLGSSGTSPIAGDIVYGNNTDNWKKFGNALRLRYALRIADRSEDKARQVIIALQGQPIISSNAENAQLIYAASPNQNPVGANFETRNDHRISQTMVERLRTLGDPRLPIYANPTAKPTPQVYVGVPNGLTNAQASNLGFDLTSRIGTYFTRSESPAVLMSYAEVLFDLSEAAARNFITGDPEALYEQAITASMKQYGIADGDVNTYLARPEVQYNAANFRESIGNQKWIALFGQGIEAFAEWRRLDYPKLTPAVNGVLNGQIPLRFIYPGSEQSLNRKSYRAAIDTQGTDALTTRLWFDKQ